MRLVQFRFISFSSQPGLCKLTAGYRPRVALAKLDLVPLGLAVPGGSAPTFLGGFDICDIASGSKETPRCSQVMGTSHHDLMQGCGNAKVTGSLALPSCSCLWRNLPGGSASP